MKLKVLTTLLLALISAAGCSKNSNNEAAGDGNNGTYNKNADPETLGYFSLPKVSDPRLINKEELPSATYSLSQIQSATISWPTGAFVNFEHKFRSLGDPRSGDALRFEVKKKASDGKDYRLAAQLNLPLEFSVTNQKMTFGTIKEYWNQVYTDNRREWALNTKPDATAINPSIDVTMNYPANKGIYSYSPNAMTLNTVFLTIEDGNVVIYLKTQLKNETAYLRLQYTPNRNIAPEVNQKTTSLTAASTDTKVQLANLLKELAELGLDVELETLGSGTVGGQSFFGSDKAQENPINALASELDLIKELLGIIKNSKEIQYQMKYRGISKIKIINPYSSVNKPGILVKKEQSILLLNLKMSEMEILDLFYEKNEQIIYKETVEKD